MSTGTPRAPTVLSAEDLESFHGNGYVRVKGASSPELARAMQDELWNELAEDHGIERTDPSTWIRLPHSPRRAKHSPLNAKLAGERFQAAISDLLGHDAWPWPATWGGFNVTFPNEPGTPMDVPADTWHWDGSPTSEGLLVFSFYSDVRPAGGGTLVLGGSHRLIADFYASLTAEELARAHRVHRRMFARWDPWLAALTGQSREPVPDRVATFMERTTEVRGVPCRVVELTGEPGDAVFCDLRLLHALVPNRLDVPRFVRVKFLFLE